MQQAEVTIAHVTVEVRRPERWRRFLAELTADRARVAWADEPARHALRITEGPRDDVVQLGLGYRAGGDLDAALARLTTAGVAWEEVAPPIGATRAVRTVDPAGTALELLVGDDAAPPDPRWPVGHVALAHPHPERLEAFYVDLIGLRCNERIATRAGPIDLHGTFLGSAVRHHALAVLDLPSRRRLHHVCFAAPDVGTVAERWWRARTAGVPVTMALGRHALPDGTTSFYAASPSGFDVELGAGGNRLDGSALEAPLAGTSTSSWGHAVSLRARLRVASALAWRALGLAA